jgi:hypothetical protein
MIRLCLVYEITILLRKWVILLLKKKKNIEWKSFGIAIIIVYEGMRIKADKFWHNMEIQREPNTKLKG